MRLEIKLYKSRVKSLKLLLVSLIFVLPSLWLIFIEKKYLFMIFLCLFFFGAATILALFNLFDRRVQLIINEKGIWDRSLKEEIIIWENIKSAYLIEINKQHFISLKLDKNFKSKQKLYKWAVWINKSVGAQNVNLNFSMIRIKKNQLTKLEELINDLKSLSLDERVIIIKKSINNF